jgi:hypothetical protein
MASHLAAVVAYVSEGNGRRRATGLSRAAEPGQLKTEEAEIRKRIEATQA